MIRFQKIIWTFLLLILAQIALSQNTKTGLLGNWVCLTVEDASGKPTIGPFGESNEYLLFNFTKKKLLISEAPFDGGLGMPYSIKDDEIEIFSEALFNLPELKFKIRSISSGSLILSSNTKGTEYNYFFSKQQFPSSNSVDSINIVDCGLIVINEAFVGTTEKPLYSYKNFDYRIYNTEPIHIPCPIFNKKNYLNFGSYLALNFKFPKYFQPERLSDEMVVDVRVSNKGFEEAKIVKGLNYEMNAAMFNLIQATNKNWNPIKVNNKIANTILRFHFQFVKTLSH